MSKIKDQIDKEYERMMQMDVSFAEFLESLEPNSPFKADWDTNEEEESSEEPSTTSTSIVPTNPLKAKTHTPINNANYYPTRRIK
jgi:hypothetical protein